MTLYDTTFIFLAVWVWIHCGYLANKIVCFLDLRQHMQTTFGTKLLGMLLGPFAFVIAVLAFIIVASIELSEENK